MFRCLARYCLLMTALVLSAAVARPAQAQDLPVVADGGHLWLVYEVVGDDGDAIQVYHQAPGDDALRLRKLERIPGRLRPNGVAAGGGRLVLVLDSGEIITRTPHQPPMTLGWSYRAGSLPALPEHCSLSSLAIAGPQPWALVRVETDDALAALDALPGEATPANAHDRRNLVLGLPPGVDITGDARNTTPKPPPPDTDSEPPNNETPDNDTPVNEPPDARSPDAETQAEGGSETETEVGTENDSGPEDAAPIAPAAPEVVDPGFGRASAPAYRLIRLGPSGWRSAALPEGLGSPRIAAMVVMEPDDERPAIVAEDTRRYGDLTAYLPTGDGGWSASSYRLPPARGWSVTSVDGQLVAAVERQRSPQIVWADLYMLRARRSVPLATLGVDTANLARWRVVGVDSEAVLFAAPGPMLQTVPQSPAIMGSKGVGLVTGTQGELKWFMPAQQTRWENNADWLIQIAAFAGAMVLMMLFWKRTPRSREVDLPPDIHLVPWPRRLTATLIDLLPGFWITGLVYGLGWDAILLQHWPGTPIPKPPVAMGPGWMVITITVFHTTAFEFITARSIGKWLTGTYVSDFRGRPAPPGASFVRAAMRLFDLVAWLLLLLPLISPYRQRLGDILAKTLVVMRDAPEPDEKAKDHDGG